MWCLGFGGIRSSLGARGEAWGGGLVIDFCHRRRFRNVLGGGSVADFSLGRRSRNRFLGGGPVIDFSFWRSGWDEMGRVGMGWDGTGWDGGPI